MTDRETATQVDKKTDRETDRQMDRQKDRETDRTGVVKPNPLVAVPSGKKVFACVTIQDCGYFPDSKFQLICKLGRVKKDAEGEFSSWLMYYASHWSPACRL